MGVQRFAPAVLRRARTGGGLSTDRLGVLVGVSGATISRWETGRNAPSPSHLLALASALEIPVDDLVRVAQDDALLLHLRERAGLTAQAAARAIGISLAAYSRIERGIDLLDDARSAQLAALYGVPTAQVLDAWGRVRSTVTRPARHK